MKNKFIDPFNYNIPTIDLHGLDREIARIKVIDFINDNFKMKNQKICIIHGNGMGILKNEVYSVLKNDKRVLEYKTSYFNQGSTNVYLKID